MYQPRVPAGRYSTRAALWFSLGRTDNYCIPAEPSRLEGLVGRITIPAEPGRLEGLVGQITTLFVLDEISWTACGDRAPRIEGRLYSY